MHGVDLLEKKNRKLKSKNILIEDLFKLRSAPSWQAVSKACQNAATLQPRVNMKIKNPLKMIILMAKPRKNL